MGEIEASSLRRKHHEMTTSLTRPVGVEETKEEVSTQNALRQGSSEEPQSSGSDEERGFRQHLEDMARSVLGSCGNALDSVFITGGCRWPEQRDNTDLNTKPPLSIAEELRKLAQLQPPRRNRDIPKFLGEDAVYSFDDDEVSALSQHTLEEMTKQGIVHPMCRHRRSSSPPPSPTRTQSSAS